MKRRVVLITSFLLLGAIVNVLIAWGWFLLQPSLIVDPRDRPVPPMVAEYALGRGINLTPEHFRGLGYIGLQSRSDGVTYIRCGLPLTSVEGVSRWGDGPSDPAWAILWPRSGLSGYAQHLPLRPVLPGFLINTLLFAFILSRLLPPTCLWIVNYRKRHRLRRGLCEKCAYPIGVSPVCTECGAAVRRMVT